MKCPKCGGKLAIELSYDTEAYLSCEDCEEWEESIWYTKLGNYLANSVSDIIASVKREDFMDEEGFLIK